MTCCASGALDVCGVCDGDGFSCGARVTVLATFDAAHAAPLRDGDAAPLEPLRDFVASALGYRPSDVVAVDIMQHARPHGGDERDNGGDNVDDAARGGYGGYGEHGYGVTVVHGLYACPEHDGGYGGGYGGYGCEERFIDINVAHVVVRAHASPPSPPPPRHPCAARWRPATPTCAGTSEETSALCAGDV
jgi:hypothetical protein